MPGLLLIKPCSLNTSLVANPDSLVNDFIIPSTRLWNKSLLERTFDRPSVDKILEIHIPPLLLADRVIWAPTISRSFSVKSAYHQIFSTRAAFYAHALLIDLKKLWKLQMHDRLKLFL